MPSGEFDYIIGNPPFVGARQMKEKSDQKDDVLHVFGKDWKNLGNLDYVACWYKKAVDYMKGRNTRAALVSTNSITQGEAVAAMWKPLFEDGCHIDFAYRSFLWDSEASQKAHVHCVIVGFSLCESDAQKTIYTSGGATEAQNINGYLINADDAFIESRSRPICDVPEIGIGNKPIDGGFYLFKESEMIDFIKKEPTAEPYFRQWYGSEEFINRRPRYCLYLGDCSPDVMRQMPEVMKRVEAVRDYRSNSTSAVTRKLAETPTKFHVTNIPNSKYILIPRHSSERRRYIPFGFMSGKELTGDACLIIPDATLYHFGVLTSNVHMAWVRAVCGRLEMRYRYSKDIVYNNFVWPEPSDEQRVNIEETAQMILNARSKYPDCSLADLYDPLSMPKELSDAHNRNNVAVMKAYGFSTKMTEEDCVAELMRMYMERIGERGTVIDTEGKVYFIHTANHKPSVALIVDTNYMGFKGVCYAETSGHPHMIEGRVAGRTGYGFIFEAEGRGTWEFHEMTYENFSREYYKYVIGGDRLKERYRTTEELVKYYNDNFPDYG